MTPAEIAAKIRAAADSVSPPYHYDTIDAQIAEAFRTLANQFEQEI